MSTIILHWAGLPGCSIRISPTASGGVKNVTISKQISEAQRFSVGAEFRDNFQQDQGNYDLQPFVQDQAGKIVGNLKGSSTLMVGETEGFAGSDGIINLTVEGNKVHFEVNPPAAQRAGLKDQFETPQLGEDPYG